MPVDTQTDATKDSETTSPPAPTDPLSDPLREAAPPTEDPTAAVTRDAAAQHAALQEYLLSLEQMFKDLPMDCERDFAVAMRDASTAGDTKRFELMSTHRAVLYSLANTAFIEVSKYRLGMLGMLPEDPTAEDYLRVNQNLISGIMTGHEHLQRMKWQSTPEALVPMFDEKLAAMWKRHTDETTRQYTLLARAAAIEAARSDQSLVEGLQRALVQSNTGD